MQSVALKKKNKFTRWISREYGYYLFLMPFILGFAIFVAYPLIMSLIYSFTDFNGTFYKQAGLFQYKKIFDYSEFGYGKDIAKSFGLTIFYSVTSIPLNLVLSYSLALFLKKEIKGVKTLRLLFYLPVLIPSIAFGQIWLDMLAYSSTSAGGIINQMLTNLNLGKLTFYSAENTQFITFLVTSQWGIGGGMIIWLAALKNISTEIYEAAEIDGANAFVKLFKLTIPMTTPIIFYNVICAVIGCMQVFDSYAYVGRGINGAMDFISVRIYCTAFSGTRNEYGFACAMAWILFVFIACLIAIMFKTSRWVFYGDEN